MSSAIALAAGAVPIGAVLDSGPATAAPLALAYDITFGGLTVMHFDLGEETAGERYRIRFTARTEGLASLVFNTHIIASSEGRLEQGSLHPESYVIDSTGETRRHTRLDYHSDGTIGVDLVPPVDAETTADGPMTLIPPDSVPGSADPLSGIVSLAATPGAEGCTGTVPVYDGRRRYDIALRPAEAGGFERSGHEPTLGPVLRCALHMTRIGGYPVKPRKRVSNDEAVLWIAKMAPDQPAVPVEIAFSGGWGVLRAHLLPPPPARTGVASALVH